MAKIQVVAVVDHLSSQMRRALEAAVEAELPDASVDAHSLFRAFKRALNSKCSIWETVPDSCVDTD
jgi:hypothetical protein